MTGANLLPSRRRNEFDSYFVSDPSLEVAGEGCRLVSLQFPVLDRLPTQIVIQLHGEDGSGGALILAALLSFKENRQDTMRTCGCCRFRFKKCGCPTSTNHISNILCKEERKQPF